MEDDENRPLFALSVCSFFQIFPEGIGNGEVIFPAAEIDIGFIFSVIKHAPVAALAPADALALLKATL